MGRLTPKFDYRDVRRQTSDNHVVPQCRYARPLWRHKTTKSTINMLLIFVLRQDGTSIVGSPESILTDPSVQSQIYQHSRRSQACLVSMDRKRRLQRRPWKAVIRPWGVEIFQEMNAENCYLDVSSWHLAGALHRQRASPEDSSRCTQKPDSRTELVHHSRRICHCWCTHADEQGTRHLG